MFETYKDNTTGLSLGITHFKEFLLRINVSRRKQLSKKMKEIKAKNKYQQAINNDKVTPINNKV